MLVFEPTASRISTHLSEGGDALTIRIDGNFDFNLHREFQRAYQDCQPAPKTYSVDLSETRHLDSAALGMLLLLREHSLAGREDRGERHLVELVNANDSVAKVLSVSNFDQIFTIR
ncbi:STAS domain-containing protein [Microbulbifer yueqingensis]|uniref:Anti-anti-sigma factor n=1 Tax=Microbulbifer yueqingensis TaxID=658219 RepID=A0A1G9ANU5_9GAMM|nr:STAS domain-containing protein [Microbulbifer yueqingensis]SDK28225.1 anti-anti-sigma factor [Microbulbifer yueqingensis]